ncbi:hypothetical protein J6590_016260 [Homalodisca vitripennis]|nr:hypothetical protein J6590_016260 [Homalodisca vitripennis]
MLPKSTPPPCYLDTVHPTFSEMAFFVWSQSVTTHHQMTIPLLVNSFCLVPSQRLVAFVTLSPMILDVFRTVHDSWRVRGLYLDGAKIVLPHFNTNCGDTVTHTLGEPEGSQDILNWEDGEYEPPLVKIHEEEYHYVLLEEGEASSELTYSVKAGRDGTPHVQVSKNLSILLNEPFQLHLPKTTRPIELPICPRILTCVISDVLLLDIHKVAQIYVTHRFCCAQC